MAKRWRRRRSNSDFFMLILLIGFLIFMTKQKIFIAAISLVIAGGLFIIALRIYRNNKAAARLKKSGIYDIDRMDGRQFEHYLGELFKSQGYKVNVTRAAGDYGADLVIERGGRRIVVQAKRYSKNVGIEAVQQVQASIAHYKASEAWVISNRFFTKAAAELASSNGVNLIDRNRLIEMVLQLNPDAAAVPTAKDVMAQIPREEKKKIYCQCGSLMALKKGPYGQFYGCTKYPACKNTKQLNQV